MKKFIYIRRQNNGCDYTIGCGISIKFIEAVSKKDAIKKIKNIDDTWKEYLQQAFEDGDLEVSFNEYISESGLRDAMNDKSAGYIADEAYLYEILSETDMMPVLRDTLKEMSDFKDKLFKQAEEKAERIQYEKLKKKFENK